MSVPFSIRVLALFVLLAVLHTWPLATAPGTLSRNDNADTVLNEWIIAWVAHQAPRDPIRLFDANIFHPEPRTLAFSEHLIVPALMVAPVLWLGGSPVLAYNLLLLAGFALTGWTMALLVARWTDDRAAGILAGCLAAFNSHTMTRLPHVQAMHIEFIAPALLALDQLLLDPRTRHAVRLGLWSGLQALCSAYWLVFTLFAITIGALVRPGDWLRRWRPLVPRFALAGLIAAVMIVPFLLPYRIAQQEQGLERSLEEVARYSAVPADYLTTGGTLHFRLWSRQFYRATDALFPGLVAIGLAAIAVGSGTAFRNARARMALAIAVAGLALSFGPSMPLYGVLYAAVPLLAGIRGAARFGHLFLIALAILSGFGFAWLRSRMRVGTVSKTTLAVVTIGVIAAANVEALRAPLGYSRFAGIPGVYTVLAAEPNAIVAELPFFPIQRVDRNAGYMLASTRHWKPMINGYSGFIPESYRRRMGPLLAFPRPEALEALRAAHVTHVIVHTDAIEGAAELEHNPAFQRLAVGQGIRIYRFK